MKAVIPSAARELLSSVRGWFLSREARSLVAALLGMTTSLTAQSLDEARDSLRIGKYQEGIALLRKVPANDSEWVDAQRELARAYATIGRYDDAESVARLAAARPGAVAANTLGEVLLLRGKRAAAESAFVRARAEHAPD